jgi:hypothetical protein
VVDPYGVGLDKGSRLAPTCLDAEQMTALHRVIHQIGQLEGQEIFEHLFLLRATCLGVFPTRVHFAERMVTLIRGDHHHCHLRWGRGEPAVRSQENC